MKQSTTNATANDNVKVTTGLGNIGFFHLPVAIPYWIFYLLQPTGKFPHQRINQFQFLTGFSTCCNTINVFGGVNFSSFNSLLDFLLVATGGKDTAIDVINVSLVVKLGLLFVEGGVIQTFNRGQ